MAIILTSSYFYYFYILLMATGFLLSFLKVIRPYSEAKKVANELKQLLSLMDENEPIEERIQQVNNWIKNNKNKKFISEFIDPSWRNYKKSFFDLRKKGIIFTPDVYNFFIEEQLMHSFGKRKLVEVIPGLFLAAGIIGTFMGIAVGVSQLSPGGSAESMQEGIGTLLHGMQVKFISSIAGILLSAIWQVIDKKHYHPMLIDAFLEVRQSFDEAFPTEEESIVLHQMMSNQIKQREDFQDFMTEVLIPTMVTGFSSSINETIAPQLEQTQIMMREMFSKSSEDQLNSINKMVDQFVESLSQVTGDHMRDLGDALNKTIEWQQKVHTEMSSLVSTLQESAIEQSKMINKTSALTMQIQDYTEKVTDYHTVMETTIEQLNQTTSQNSSLQRNISDLLDNMVQERTIFDEHFNNHLGILGEKVADLNSQTNLQIQLNDQFESNLEKVVEISGLQQTLSLSLEKQVEQSLSSNSELNKLISSMTESGKTQVDLQKHINSAIEKMSDERIKFDNLLSLLNENLYSQVGQMDQRIDMLKHIWDSAAKELNTVNKQLSSSMNQFTSDMHTGLQNTFSQFDEELSKSVNYLSKAVSAIQEGVVDLPDAIETLKKSVNQLNKHTKSMANSI